MNIISGALDLKQKTVANVMTKLEEVYMLPIDAVLDFDTVSEIMSNGILNYTYILYTFFDNAGITMAQ